MMELLEHKYANYSITKLFKLLDKKLRINYLSTLANIIDKNIEFLNTYSLTAIRTILQSNLSEDEERIMVKSFLSVVDKLLKDEFGSVILETMITLFHKPNVEDLELQIIENWDNLVDTTYGYHLVNKLVVLNMQGTYTEYRDLYYTANKSISESEVERLYIKSQDYLKDKSSSTKVFKTLITYIFSNFIEFIENKNGLTLMNILIDKIPFQKEKLIKIVNKKFCVIQDEDMLKAALENSYYTVLINLIKNFPEIIVRINALLETKSIKKSHDNFSTLAKNKNGLRVIEAILSNSNEDCQLKLYSKLTKKVTDGSIYLDKYAEIEFKVIATKFFYLEEKLESNKKIKETKQKEQLEKKKLKSKLKKDSNVLSVNKDKKLSSSTESTNFAEVNITANSINYPNQVFITNPNLHQFPINNQPIIGLNYMPYAPILTNQNYYVVYPKYLNNTTYPFVPMNNTLAGLPYNTLYSQYPPSSFINSGKL